MPNPTDKTKYLSPRERDETPKRCVMVDQRSRARQQTPTRDIGYDPKVRG